MTQLPPSIRFKVRLLFIGSILIAIALVLSIIFNTANAKRINAELKTKADKSEKVAVVAADQAQSGKDLAEDVKKACLDPTNIPADLLAICPKADAVASQPKPDVVTSTKGEDGRDGVDGKPGTPGNNGLPGVNGKDGLPGVNGKDGESIQGESGENGKDGKDGADGQPGTKGDKGDTGEAGPPGTSVGGFIFTDENGQTYLCTSTGTPPEAPLFNCQITEE